MTEKGKAVVEYRSQGGVDISLTPETVRNFLVQGKKELVSAQELMYFMNVCKARKLNPFIKDCYLIKYGKDPAAIVTSVDYFRKNARKAPDCKGWKAGIVILQNGEITYREGSLILEEETLIGGWAEAKPEGWDEPKRHTINLAGYIKKKFDGSITSFWKPEKQPDMIAKVAESQLLRQLWGEETTGMYSVEEMPSIEDARAAGGDEPLQSDIKKRILKKLGPDKVDLDKVDPVKQGEYPPDPKAAHERIEKRVEERELKKIEEKRIASESPEPDPPKDEVPVPLTDAQIVAIENMFSAHTSAAGIDDAIAFKYVEHIKSVAGMTTTGMMKSFNEDPKRNIEFMREWIAKNSKKPEAETNGKKKKKIPLKDLESKSKAWESENWSRLKSAGFSTYVWKNIATLSAEPEVLQKAVRRKWGKLFKEDFPTSGENKIGGNGNNGMIQAEVVHDPAQLPEDEDFQQPAPDKEADPDAYIKWLRGNFNEELDGAYDYLEFGGRMISGLTDAEKAELIKCAERLVDMNNTD